MSVLLRSGADTQAENRAGKRPVDLLPYYAAGSARECMQAMFRLYADKWACTRLLYLGNRKCRESILACLPNDVLRCIIRFFLAPVRVSLSPNLPEPPPRSLFSAAERAARPSAARGLGPATPAAHRAPLALLDLHPRPAAERITRAACAAACRPYQPRGQAKEREEEREAQEEAASPRRRLGLWRGT